MCLTVMEQGKQKDVIIREGEVSGEKFREASCWLGRSLSIERMFREEQSNLRFWKQKPLRDKNSEKRCCCLSYIFISCTPARLQFLVAYMLNDTDNYSYH